MLTDAPKLSGLELSEEERTALVDNANQPLTRYDALHKLSIPTGVSPPFDFNAIVPGMRVNRARQGAARI